MSSISSFVISGRYGANFSSPSFGYSPKKTGSENQATFQVQLSIGLSKPKYTFFAASISFVPSDAGYATPQVGA